MTSTLVAVICLGLACHCVAEAQYQKPIAFHHEAHSTTTTTTTDEPAPPYRAELLKLHKSLIEIESITGNEHNVGNFLVGYFHEHGYRTKIQVLPSSSSENGGPEATSPRFNVIAAPSAAKDGPEWRPRLVVSSHIDVVPPYIPYSIEGEPPVSDTVIRGRGSVDAKASISAQITAANSLLASSAISPNDILLLYVVGEETIGDGMRYLSDSLSSPGGRDRIEFDAVIFGEPTENKLACGHKGHMACTISAKGKAGHSGYPWLGKSATEVLIRALLKILDTDLGSSEQFGNTTVNVGVLEGGVAANVIPESAHARIAVRVAIGDHKVVFERIEAILKEIDEEALSMHCDNGYGVIKCNCDVEGFDSIVVNYGTDVPNFKGNHTRYLYGPGDILVAHSDHEALHVRDLEAAVEGYKKLIKHALGV